jgi:hypothetical protein
MSDGATSLILRFALPVLHFAFAFCVSARLPDGIWLTRPMILKRPAPMLRELMSLLPDAIARCSPVVAVACAAMGVVLWLCGARFSRSILSLIAVAAGTVIGMRLPQWRGWQIDGMGLAVGGAIVLGSGVFLFHRTCIAAILGGAMMLWAGGAVWIYLAGDVYWDWRSARWDGDLMQYCRDAWAVLPPNLSHIFPAVCFLGLAAGITIAAFLPKVSKVLAHSLIGVTLIVLMGAVAMSTALPRWLSAAPGSLAAQGVALIGLVLIGAAIQWRLTPPFRNSASIAPGNATRQS